MWPRTRQPSKAESEFRGRMSWVASAGVQGAPERSLRLTLSELHLAWASKLGESETCAPLTPNMCHPRPARLNSTTKELHAGMGEVKAPCRKTPQAKAVSWRGQYHLASLQLQARQHRIAPRPWLKSRSRIGDHYTHHSDVQLTISDTCRVEYLKRWMRYSAALRGARSSRNKMSWLVIGRHLRFELALLPSAGNPS